MEIVDFKGAKIGMWKAGPSVFLADLRRGARLMNWHVNLADGEVRDVIHWPEDADMGGGFAQVRGGNPVLFPFCGRSFSGGKADCWMDPDGRERPMRMHGFARDAEFEILSADKSGFCARMLQDAAFTEEYPYGYDFTVAYKFSELSFSCELRLENLENFKIPWAAGHHFYFTLPWIAGTDRKDYRLDIASKKQFFATPGGELVETDALAQPDFDLSTAQNRVHCKLKGNKISFGPKSAEEDIFMTLGDSPKPPATTTVVTWAQDEGSAYFCVEPWMGPPNSAGNLKNASWVDGKSSRTFTVEVSLF